MTDRPGFAAHDHNVCRKAAKAAARPLGLTPVRQAALDCLLEGHRAMSAYDVLAALARKGFGSQPPVAYRALDYLRAQGLAHRIESLNAYVACAAPGAAHAPAFLICKSCRRVAEDADGPGAGTLAAAADEAGFELRQPVVEAVGLCPDCRTTGDPAHG